MTISDLILKLQQLEFEHGDLEVVASDFGCGCCGGYAETKPHLYTVGQGDHFDWDSSSSHSARI